MADGYLENQYAAYEKRKAEWLRKRKLAPHPRPAKPEDEAL